MLGPLLDTIELPLYAIILGLLAVLAIGYNLAKGSKSKNGSKGPVDELGPQFEVSKQTGFENLSPKSQVGITNGAEASGPSAIHALEGAPHIPLKFKELSVDQMKANAKNFYDHVRQRRSCRFFSDKDVPLEVIENIIRTAGTAPSGANTQPWTFAVVKSMDLKEQIKALVEAEEKINYEKRMSKKWLEDLKSLGTNHLKPYLTLAPYLIVVFKQTYNLRNGKREPHYYFETSVGIACGILITAIHNAGLVTLTSTPMNAGPKLRDMLGRPKNEKVLLLLPVGYPADDATVPNIGKKRLDEIMKVF